jgi:tRNA (guanine37-N1)-methyltransferase
MIRMMSPALRFDVLSLFPKSVDGFAEESILGKAVAQGLIEINSLDLRRWAEGKHRETDDRPFGGGAGMVLKPQPIFDAIEDISTDRTQVIYATPDGEPFTSELAKELSHESHIVFLSGHYEGIDQRVRDHVVHREISIGDYVITNGTLASAVMIDAISRHIPGVLGDPESLENESFESNQLSHPQYTRPHDFRGMKVPQVLLSGNHEEISKWRENERLVKTERIRPDLLNANTQS